MATLDAVDRDAGLRLRVHEDRAVEDTVLLGTDELLAFVQEDAHVERVQDGEIISGSGMVDLGDAKAMHDGFV